METGAHARKPTQRHRCNGERLNASCTEKKRTTPSAAQTRPSAPRNHGWSRRCEDEPLHERSGSFRLGGEPGHELGLGEIALGKRREAYRQTFALQVVGAR